jgi:hypothetical protein
MEEELVAAHDLLGKSGQGARVFRAGSRSAATLGVLPMLVSATFGELPTLGVLSSIIAGYDLYNSGTTTPQPRLFSSSNVLLSLSFSQFEMMRWCGCVQYWVYMCSFLLEIRHTLYRHRSNW